MSSQDRKYLRFRFFRILVLLILFTSPTTPATDGLSIPESCLKLKSALMTSQSDNEFHKLIIECLVSAAWQNLSPSAINIFRGLIKNIPSEIANSAKGGFVIVSVYLIFISNNLYKQAVILSEDCKLHRDKLEEVEVVLQEMKKQISPMSKSIGYAELYEQIEELLKIMDELHIELKELTNNVKNDIIKSRHNKPWAIAYIITAAGCCVGSFFVTGWWVRVPTCLCTLGVILQSSWSLHSLEENIKQLNELQKEMKTLKLELAKYRTKLRVDLPLMKGKLNHSLPIH